MRNHSKLIFVTIIVLLFAVGGVLSYDIIKESIDSSPNTSFGDKLKNDGAKSVSSEKYWYKSLSSNEKKAYDNIYNEIKDFPQKISVPKINSKELGKVFVALSYDNPELFFLSKSSSIESVGFKYYFVPQYIMLKQEYELNLQKVNAIVENIKSRTLDMNEYEKELYIHDYIIENCEYFDDTSDEIKFTVYGVLVLGRANCEGYSRSAQMLLNAAGVDCRIIVGDATNQENVTRGHMWNVVTINQREYNLDVTWDDYELMDKKQEKLKLDPSHMYFNIPTIEISTSHKADPHDDNINCVYDDDNFFKVTGVYLDKYNSSAQRKIVDEISSEYSNGKKSMEFKFSNADAYNIALDKITKQGDISRLVKRANLKTSKTIPNKNISYIGSKDKKIIRIFFN